MAGYEKPKHMSDEEWQNLAQTHRDRREFAIAMRRAGHKLQDIGDALGVCRERARQLIVGYSSRGVSSGAGLPEVNISQLTAAYAECNGNAAEVARRLKLTHSSVVRFARALDLRKDAQEQYKEQRREWLVNTIRTLAAKKGRTPTTYEVGWALFPKISRASAQVVPFSVAKKLFAGGYREAVERAGCVPRSCGGKGHITGKCARKP